MSVLTIQETLHQCADGRVVLACDDEARSLLAVSPHDDAATFVQIDRVTALELQRGTLDVRTAMMERCAGLVIGA